MSEETFKLELELTSEQYQQLVETVFLGGSELEDKWTHADPYNRHILSSILEQRSKWGKDSLGKAAAFGGYDVTDEVVEAVKGW